MKLRCPYCNQKLDSDQELETGTPVECPKCAKTFTVTAGNVGAESAERARAAKPAPAARPAKPAPQDVRITGISIPFLDMVLLLVEIALAAIPAALVLAGICYMVVAILGNVR